MSNETETLARLAIAVAAKRAAAAEQKLQRMQELQATQAAAQLAAPDPTEQVREFFRQRALQRQTQTAEDVVRAVFAEMHDQLRGADGRNVTPAEAEALVRQVVREQRYQPWHK